MTTASPPHNPRIGFLPEYPAPIIYGGLEMFCVRACSAVQGLGLNARLVDHYDPSQQLDILHITGNPPGMCEVALHAARTKRVVFSAVFGGAARSVPHSLAVKGFSWIVERFGQRIDHTRVRTMFAAASHIICLNQIERDFVAERYGIPETKLSVVPVGIEDEFFSASPERFVAAYGMRDFVLFTGNIIPRKNPLRLAKSLTSLGVKGVFIGKRVATDPDYAASFAEHVAADPNLLWIEGLPLGDPLLASAYAASAAFCLPSFAEGQSASTLEAMAASKPLILADRPYAYQGCYPKALRCDPASVASIAQAVKTALDSPDAYAYQLPDEHRWSSVAASFATIYQTLSPK